ncbi:MAG: PAS domain S-box protein [Nitrospirae bacterium]|nr:PAS domain S-box protein [Nitrospirota bacterium]
MIKDLKKTSECRLTDTPLAFLAIVAGSVFLGELTLMYLIPDCNSASKSLRAVIDSALLSVVILPVLYLFLYRPLTAKIAECRDTKDRLQGVNQELSIKLCELSSSEERFEILMETIPDVVYRLDADGRFVYVNKTIKKLGYDPDELIGQHFSVILDPKDIDNVSSAKVLPPLKGQITGEDGAPKLFDERRTFLRSTTGLEVRVLRKTAKTQDYADADPLVVEISSSGLYDAACTTNNDELLGTVGVMKPKEAPLTAIKKQNEINGTVGVIRDISRRKQTEKALRISERHFRMISDNIPSLLWMSGADAHVVFVNRKWIEFTGLSFQEDIDRCFKEVIHPDDLQDTMAVYMRAYIGYDSLEVQHRIRSADGQYVWFLNRAVPLFIPDAGFRGYIGLCIDISQLKSAEAALNEKTRQLKDLTNHLNSRVKEEIEKGRQKEQLLIQQSKMAAMGEMIGAIAHQWRQPLNAISVLLFDVKDAYDFGELDGVYLERSCQKAHRQLQFMSHTIDDFRDFFKPTKEKIVFNVTASIRDVLSIISHQFSNNTINLNIQTTHENEQDAPPLSVYGYPNEFKQVIINIFNNAKDAIIEKRRLINRDSIEEGNIDIVISCTNEMVFIEITDNGPGIPPALKYKIFEPYFTTKQDSNGTGIGLYMSKVIIEDNMNGRLYTNDSPSGASFTIELRQVNL